MPSRKTGEDGTTPLQSDFYYNLVGEGLCALPKNVRGWNHAPTIGFLLQSCRGGSLRPPEERARMEPRPYNRIFITIL